jgi:hypothetical protein
MISIIEISKEQIERAKKLYPFKELKGSITKGKSNIYGALGEIIIYDINKKKPTLLAKISAGQCS